MYDSVRDAAWDAVTDPVAVWVSDTVAVARGGLRVVEVLSESDTVALGIA